MGNENGTEKNYPAAIQEGVISVGATTNNDVRAGYSNKGSWLDVVAPGGGMASGEPFDLENNMYATLPGNSYGYSYQASGSFNLSYTFGTSFATPVVSGIAALLLSEEPTLYNDDIENLIEISAEDINGGGFDNELGHGRVNAKKALDLLQSPYTLTHSSTTGGSIYDYVDGNMTRFYDVSGLNDGQGYYAARAEVRKTIFFSWMDQPNVWCRGVESVGFTPKESDDGKLRIFGQGFCEVVPGTLTNTSATLRTYVYNVSAYNALGQPAYYLGKFPTTESNVEFAYTVHGIPGTPPPSANISGPVSIETNQNYTYNAIVSDGVPPYSYQWAERFSGSSSWTNIGTGSSIVYGSLFPGQVSLRVTVTDSNSEIDVDIQNILITDGSGCVICKQVALPTDFVIKNNYPNPFNPSTQIKFELPETAKVSIKVYNIMGQEVATLVNGQMRAGFHNATFKADNLASGVYIARLTAIGTSGEQFISEIKMQLIK